MSKVNDSALWLSDNAANGDVVDQTAWNQNNQVFKAAINDNQDQINQITGSQTTQVIEVTTGYPSTPGTGEMVYRSDLRQIHMWNGTKWIFVAGQPNPNLLINPSGAYDFGGWTPTGGSWQSVYSSTSIGNYFKSPSLNASGYAVLTQTVHTTSGVTYTFQAHIDATSASAGNAYIEVDAYDSGNNVIAGSQVQSSYVNYGESDLFALTFTTPTNTDHIEMKYVCDSNLVGNANFYQGKLEEGAVATDFTDDNEMNMTEFAGTIFPSNFASNGYQRLPNGFILQWVIGTCTSTGTQLSWSLPFPNGFIHAWANVNDGSLFFANATPVSGSELTTVNVRQNDATTGHTCVAFGVGH